MTKLITDKEVLGLLVEFWKIIEVKNRAKAIKREGKYKRKNNYISKNLLNN